MAAKGKKTGGEKAAPQESVYINRELSWMAFNQRVLLEAADTAVPLLERLKFLMIYQSNLEEFYRVRIGILTHRALLTPDKADPVSGMNPEEQIQAVLKVTREQQSLAESVWKAIREDLRSNSIDVLDFKKISKVDELMSKKLFGDLKNQLTPQIIGLDAPLPFLWSGESYLIAFLGRGGDQKLALVPLDRVPGYLSFDINGSQKIVLTAQLVRHFLPLLLKKETITQSAVVKVTRNADVFLNSLELDRNADLRQKMSSLLTKRRREMPVRVQFYGKLSDQARSLLMKKLKISDRCAFTTSVPFDLSFRSCVGGREGFKYEERRPARDIGLKKGEYFPYIERHDLLMAFPFQSMLPFVDLLYEAADDPEVLSIKITLYRMSASSKIAAALAYAADKGKDVLCLLELRARFDEQNNIDYSEMLEDAGCRVIYGLPGHKVHSKLCVITRRRGGNLSYITQVGTGNYNEVTGDQYTDLSLFTADPAAGLEAEGVFAALEAGEIPPECHTLWVAPLSFKTRLLELLDREKAKGEHGRVTIKINSMNSLELMEKLVECSQAGNRVELFIRGICCLRPGIPGKTENITVKSVVGRWLEHSRIYKFGQGEDARYFLGSGDLLNRNLERRVEAFMEARTPEIREQLEQILLAFRRDTEKARVMQADGSYLREPGGGGTSCQEALYRYFSTRLVTPVGQAPESGVPTQKAVQELVTPVSESVQETETPASEPVQEPVQAPEKEPETPISAPVQKAEREPVKKPVTPVSEPVRARVVATRKSTQRGGLLARLARLLGR